MIRRRSHRVPPADISTSGHVIVMHVLVLLFSCVSQLLADDERTLGGACPTGGTVQHVDPSAAEASGIFDDLTPIEMTSVIDYMRAQKCFDLREFDDVTINTTYIHTIELMPLVKSEALQYLDRFQLRQRMQKVDDRKSMAHLAPPLRFAQVVLYRGDLVLPVIEEYSVGPLPNPTSHVLIQRPYWKSPLPYRTRSVWAAGDARPMADLIGREVSKMNGILQNVTGGYIFGADCGKRCLTYSIGLPGSLNESRSFWITVQRYRTGSLLSPQPVGLEIRIDVSSMKICEWKVDFVWFRGVNYSTIDELLQQHRSRPVKELFRPSMKASAGTPSGKRPVDRHAGSPPDEPELNVHSSPIETQYPSSWRFSQSKEAVKNPASSSSASSSSSSLAAEDDNDEDDITVSRIKNAQKGERRQRGPRIYMPDGRRYVVKGRHVQWQGWSFDFGIRSSLGAQLFDIRFDNERIVYELSLQELVSVSSGDTPATILSATMQSMGNMEAKSYQLAPGIDCPEDATYFDFVHYSMFRPALYPRSACLFEMTDSVPLRRHHYRRRHRGQNEEEKDGGQDEKDVGGQDGCSGGKNGYGGDWTMGKADHVLILRTVVVAGDIDYILDYEFHENAVLKIVCSVSGFIPTRFYVSEGKTFDPYGYPVLRETSSCIHEHLANFKIDIDINGAVNRYASLDIGATSKENISKRRFLTNIKTEEVESLYNYNLNAPRVLLFYGDVKSVEDGDTENEGESFSAGDGAGKNISNRYGSRRSFRIEPISLVKSLVQSSDEGSYDYEDGLAWVQYQVAVTQRKENEPTSSTPYNLLDLADPVLNFDDYNADDDSLIDEDLVAWVTVGTIQVPSTEDIPHGRTTRSQMSILLQPFNYFNIDPSLSSYENLRVTTLNDGQQKVDRPWSSDGEQPPPIDCLPVMARTPTVSGGGVSLWAVTVGTTLNFGVSTACIGLATAALNKMLMHLAVNRCIAVKT